MEDKPNERAKKRIAVGIMSPEKQHPGIMECLFWKLDAPERMMSLKNSMYVEVVREMARRHVLRLKNVE